MVRVAAICRLTFAITLNFQLSPFSYSLNSILGKVLWRNTNAVVLASVVPTIVSQFGMYTCLLFLLCVLIEVSDIGLSLQSNCSTGELDTALFVVALFSFC